MSIEQYDWLKRFEKSRFEETSPTSWQNLEWADGSRVDDVNNKPSDEDLVKQGSKDAEARTAALKRIHQKEVAKKDPPPTDEDFGRAFDWLSSESIDSPNRNNEGAAV